jgi:hypothetical protein
MSRGAIESTGDESPVYVAAPHEWGLGFQPD